MMKRRIILLNGSTPSANSSQYSGVELRLIKAGNYVVSVIVINKHNLSSPVTRVSYNVSEEKTYTKDEGRKYSYETSQYQIIK